MESNPKWEQNTSSSSDTEDEFFKPSSSKKRRYTQKLRKSWFNDKRLSEWITQVDDDHIMCKYCECTLKPKLSILLTHGKTSKHASALRNNCKETFEFSSFQDDPLSKPSIELSPVYNKPQEKRTTPKPDPKVENKSPYYELEKLKTEALVARYKAEAGYFNELAELTRSKRVYMDLQCQQLQKEINK